MAKFLIILAAIYMIFVGINGNAEKFSEQAWTDAKGMAPYLFGWAFVAGMAGYTPPPVNTVFKGFLWLLIVVYIAKDGPELAAAISYYQKEI